MSIFFLFPLDQFQIIPLIPSVAATIALAGAAIGIVLMDGRKRRKASTNAPSTLDLQGFAGAGEGSNDKDKDKDPFCRKNLRVSNDTMDSVHSLILSQIKDILKDLPIPPETTTEQTWQSTINEALKSRLGFTYNNNNTLARKLKVVKELRIMGPNSPFFRSVLSPKRKSRNREGQRKEGNGAVGLQTT